MGSGNLEKDQYLLEKRFIELSRNAYQRDFITYSDFLNLNEQNILHTLPKENLFTQILTFGGYGMAERQMAAFIPDALYLRCGKKELDPALIRYPFKALQVLPLNRKFSEDLTHRDYLGSILNLGIDRSKTGDILIENNTAILFAHDDIVSFLCSELTRIRHTSVKTEELPSFDIQYTPKYEELTGTVASVRLDSLLSLAFSSSRTKLSGLIEGGRVFVNLLQVMATSQMKVILSLFAKWENFVLQESEIKPENTEYTSGYRNIFRDGETQWLCKKKIRNFVYLKAIL